MSRNNSGSATAGGPRSEGMSRTLTGNFLPGFQSVTDSLEVRRAEFRALMAEAVRKLRPYARTRHERQVLDDAARGRMSMNALETIYTIAAREPLPVVMQDVTDRAVFDRVPLAIAPCAFEASEMEQRTNETLNLAQLKANRERDNASRWLEVADYCGPQLHATIRLRDAAWLKARDGAA